ncbi:MAG: substrate-binding periplasmic protein [Alphaproteobacteria bacterium]|jgi:polar amino acid transport system substrate-binding protein|nr:ABC transporter substrate-binding protein [Alphaproteobacteria bacterium]
MKKMISSLLLASALILSGCSQEKDDNTLTFAVCADYPPFEYLENDKLVGLDVDLATALAKEMGKGAHFENLPFASLLASVQTGSAHAAISTLTVTEERKRTFDFTDSYFLETLTAVYKEEHPVNTADELKGKKIGCQIGTTTEIWLKDHLPGLPLTVMDTNNQVIEALKAGHIDVAVLDGAQGVLFSKMNKGLASKVIATSDTGYCIAVAKGSPLKDMLNAALKKLKDNGTLQALTQKWVG